MPTTPHALLLAAALFAAAPAKAEDAPARDQLLFTTFWVGRYYPIGIDAQGGLVFNHRIGDSQDLLFKTRHLSLSATGTYNPAEWSVQAAAEWEPIAVFQLRGWFEHRWYPGVYGEILSFNYRTPAFNDAAIAAESSRAQATQRTTFRLEPKLRAAFPTPIGDIGLQDVIGLSYGVIRVRSGDTVYYDPGADLLMPVDGFTFSNQLAAMYLGGPFTAGALWEYFAPRGLGPENQVHRLGLLAAYTFFDKPTSYVNKPTLFALASFNVVHRGRAGLMPTIVMGVSTETDLFIRR